MFLFFLETWGLQVESKVEAFALYSTSSYPSKMPSIMSCNIWQTDLNLKGRHWCQQQVNTKLQMCIDCLDAPGDTVPAERTLFTSQISQNVEAAQKKNTDELLEGTPYEFF